LSRAVATLGTAEEHTSLARALSQLSEVQEKVESVHQAQSDTDFYVLSELIHDYVGMVHAVKVMRWVTSRFGLDFCQANLLILMLKSVLRLYLDQSLTKLV